MRYPNLFLVGAPKCGTSTMAHALGQHPSIFAPVAKEPFYFGRDFVRHSAPPERDYLSLYRRWSGERYALDASTQYLYSRTAAEEIKAASPEARIMVMVRNPVEACHSLYRQNRYAGIEPLETFEESLAAEAERATWTTPPKHCHLEQLLYRRVYAFAENIARYHAAFGEDRVHVTLLEDMRADPQGELAKVWSFLGLDPIEVPAEVRNRGTKRAVLPGLVRFAISPPPWLGRVLSFVPKERRVQVREALKRLGTSA